MQWYERNAAARAELDRLRDIRARAITDPLDRMPTPDQAPPIPTFRSRVRFAIPGDPRSAVLILPTRAEDV